MICKWRIFWWACSERDAQRAAAQQQESEGERQLRDVHNLSNQLANRNQPIQEYIAQNKADALQRLTADLDACKRRQDKLEAEAQVSQPLLWPTSTSGVLSWDALVDNGHLNTKTRGKARGKLADNCLQGPHPPSCSIKIV